MHIGGSVAFVECLVLRYILHGPARRPDIGMEPTLHGVVFSRRKARLSCPPVRKNSVKIKKLYYLIVIIFVLFQLSTPKVLASGEAFLKFTIELEAGPVWQSRNDAQVPNNENGTRFSLVDLIGYGPYPAARLYLTWNVNEIHGFRILLAPLSITDSGILESPVSFSGEKFDSGIPTEATYKFNSWRITYRYRFYKGSRFRWWIGFTAKIRDAKIQLDQPGKSAQKTDVGFVPLLHLNGRFRFSEQWQLLLGLDALAGGPGRAEDLALKLCYDVNERWSILGGYRMIEGGADVEEVYNFAWFHYFVFCSEYKF